MNQPVFSPKNDAGFQLAFDLMCSYGVPIGRIPEIMALIVDAICNEIRERVEAREVELEAELTDIETRLGELKR